jgi:hypothetical protein
MNIMPLDICFNFLQIVTTRWTREIVRWENVGASTSTACYTDSFTFFFFLHLQTNYQAYTSSSLLVSVFNIYLEKTCRQRENSPRILSNININISNLLNST